MQILGLHGKFLSIFMAEKLKKASDECNWHKLNTFMQIYANFQLKLRISLFFIAKKPDELLFMQIFADWQFKWVIYCW